MKTMILLPDYSKEHIRTPHHYIVMVNVFDPAENQSRVLYDDILDIGFTVSKLKDGMILRHKCNTVGEFSEYIDSLKSKIIEGKGIILHIDGHSSIEGMDFYLRVANEKIKWGELAPLFASLYRHTRGKLFLSVSTCWGLNATQLMNSSLKHDFFDGGNAPFTHLVGAVSEITNQQSRDFWFDLYRSMIIGKPVTCFAKTNFFVTSMTGQIHSLLNDDGFDIDLKERQLRAMENTGHLVLQDELAIRRDKLIKKHVYQYLMLNEFPELKSMLDLRLLAGYLNDSDLLIQNMESNDWQ